MATRSRKAKLADIARRLASMTAIPSARPLDSVAQCLDAIRAHADSIGAELTEARSEDAPAYVPGPNQFTQSTPPARFFGNAADVWTDARQRLAADMGKREVMLGYFLDVRHRLVECWTIGIGSLTGVEVHPREVFRHGIEIGAASAIFCHNHPSNDPSPSRQDVELTTRLRAVGELCGIAVLDHVVVCADGFVSLSSRGWS